MPRPFFDAIAVRVAVLWIVLRVVGTMGSSGADQGPLESLAGAAATPLILIPFVVLAMRLDMARRSELVFLANLGFSFGRIATLIVCECLVFEVALRLALV